MREENLYSTYQSCTSLIVV